MYGKISSGCLHGIDGKLIEVEIDIQNGLPQMNIVGLPDGAIRESVERVRSAIKNSEFSYPLQRITVNLAPANLRKEGSAFDLAIAAGILSTSGQIRIHNLSDCFFVGELALDGALRPIQGVLALVQEAKANGVGTIVLPIDNAAEALLVEGIDVVPLKHLTDLKKMQNKTDWADLVNSINIHSHKLHPSEHDGLPDSPDYADVRGNLQAKRALTVAAAGMHNIILIGPPGSGKTMLLRRLPSILVEMSDTEAMEVTKISSISGLSLTNRRLVKNRPFRSPHHTISQAGLIGGGSPAKPGEVTLAHRGVLFLDEIPEFPRYVLEVLRQPLEDGHVTISRARGVYEFPSRFILAATMNPCPCGYFGYETQANTCSCHEHKISSYRSKVSGPLLDRIDLHVAVPNVNFREWAVHTEGRESGIPELSSADMLKMVQRAQAIQADRFRGLSIRFNSEMSGKILREHCRINAKTEQTMLRSFAALGLSARAHDRVLKISRTIADLENSEQIETPHLAEALQYRTLDRKSPR